MQVTIVYRGTPVAEGHLFRDPSGRAPWSGFVRPLAAGWPLVRDTLRAAEPPPAPAAAPPADPAYGGVTLSALEGDAAASVARRFTLAEELQAVDARTGARMHASHVWLIPLADGRVFATAVDWGIGRDDRDASRPAV